MSKVFNYMILAVGITFLMKFGGIPSGADSFIAWLGLSSDASGVSLGAFFIGVAAVFAIGATGGIVIGFFTKSSPETYIIAPIAAGIFTILVSTFVSIVNYAAGMGWIYHVLYLVLVPLIMAFGIAIVDWWRGVG